MVGSWAASSSTPPAARPGSYGVIPAFAAVAACLVFFGSAGYVAVNLASRATAPLRDNEFSSADSPFHTSAFVWIVLFALMLFNPRRAFGLKLKLALILSLVGFPVLAMAIDAHDERVAEDRAFSAGGAFSAKIYPIVGTSEHHGRGISYYAQIDPSHHGNPVDLKISKPDFDRIGSVSPREIYAARVPDAKFCVTLKIQTSGKNSRIMWSAFEDLPSERIAPCSPAQIAANQQSYHEAQLVHYTPEQCAKLKAETADQYNQIEKYKAGHLVPDQPKTGIFSGPFRHFTPADVGPIYGGHGSTREVICP